MTSALVHQNDVIAIGQQSHNRLAFGLFLLRKAHTARVAHIGYDGDAETHVVRDSLLVHLDQRGHLWRVGLADNNQFDVHRACVLFDCFG